jgi:tripartite-type tricarboxylate transporter receptor subunit TctC
VLITRKDLPADTLQQFLDYVKTNERSMQYGSAGAINRLTCAMLTTALGVKITHIAYRGGGQALQDLIAGRVDYECPLAAVAIPHTQSGRVKAIAVLTKNRLPSLPDLATAHEQGLLNFDSSSWFALFLPKGAQSEIVRKLHDVTIATMNTADVQERLKRMGSFLVAPERRSPEYLQAFVESEISKWAAPIRAIGLSEN